MPALAQSIISVVLAAAFAFNMSLGSFCSSVTVTDTDYGKDYIVYYLKADVEGKKTPVKVVYHRPNKMKISYKKNGNDVEFNYEHEGSNSLSKHDQELIQQIKQEMIKHSNTWLGRSSGKLRGLLTDFRDTLMRRPAR